MLACEQDVRLAQGDAAGAFASGLDVIEMSYDLERGGGLLHLSTAYSLQAAGHRRMAECIDRLPVDACDALLARFVRVLSGGPPLSAVFREERSSSLACTIDMLDHSSYGSLALRGGVSEPCRGQQQEEGCDDSPNEVRKVGERVYGQAAWRWQRDAVLRQMDEYLSAVPAQVDLPAAGRAWPRRPSAQVADDLVPDLRRAMARADTALARSRLLVCALAIRAYRLRRAHLPQSLAQLGLDGRVSADPFTGKPLIYRPGRGGYLLYSVGPDLTDDGGVPVDEAQVQAAGDLGVRRYLTFRQGGRPNAVYGQPVPHMRTPTP